MWYETISIISPLIVLCFSSVAAQETIFVAPDGSDTNPGTMELPLASIQKAQEMVSAGDTVYIRGGTYQATEDQISQVVQNLFASLTYLDKSGTEGNWSTPDLVE